MTTSKTIVILASLVGSTAAFTSISAPKTAALHMASSVNEDSRPIYDPFNLYGENSAERMTGQVRTLEPKVSVTKPIVDPMNLYSDKTQVDEGVDMSDALPFVARPITLNRQMAGDVGFDPFNFADSEENLLWQRKAELKHARIAMLAAVGWPLSELFDKPLAQMWDMKPLLGFGDRVPSILNGGLAKVPPLYWVAVLAVASAIELKDMNNNDSNDGLYSKTRMDVAEIQNGRLAMMAIVGFAVQEFVTKIGVVNQTLLWSASTNSSAAT